MSDGAVQGADVVPRRSVIERRRGLVPIDLAELWRYRELFWFLSWRDIQVRYKQTLIGVAWAVIQPLLTMVVLTLVFGTLGGFGSKGAPHAVMTFAALLPWQFFANALSESSASLVAQRNLVTKVYFPRLVVPCSAAFSGSLDFLVSLVILFLLMAGYRVTFRPHLLLLPVFILLALITALGAGFWLSALNARYRDVKYAIPFLTRMGLYICPVAFMSEEIAKRWSEGARFVYSLNPMVGVIDGFRWAILGSDFTPYWPGFWASVAVAAVVFVTGAYFFRFTEKSFADII